MAALAHALPKGKIHLPSVHVRNEETGNGFDYEENLFIRRRLGLTIANRVISFAFVQAGQPLESRETRDELSADEAAFFSDYLPLLMDEGNEEAQAWMQQRAEAEFERQARIAAGAEQACASCGCSETRACSGGCVWATQALCSRCVR